MRYNEKIMNEFYNPQNVGVIRGADVKGKSVAQDTREILKIYIQVENNVIKNANFQAFGGVVAIAATSVATRLMLNKTVEDAGKITAEDIFKELGDVPESKKYLIGLAIKTVQDAVSNYSKKIKGEKIVDED